MMACGFLAKTLRPVPTALCPGIIFRACDTACKVGPLKARKILDQHCLPYNTSDVDRGRFRVKLKHHNGNPQINNGNGQIYGQTYVTQKGLRWLADLMGVEIEEAA